MAHFPTKGHTDAPESGPPPEAISMSKGYAAARAIAKGVAYAATRGHDDIWGQAAAKNLVWVHIPTTARVCIDVH